MAYPTNTTAEESITSEERFRRVIIVATNFMRNLAIVRAASKYPGGWKSAPLHAQVNFWRVAIGNSIDASTLEYCKLFADKAGKQSWQRFVKNPEKFKRELLAFLGIAESEMMEYDAKMRAFRDKFVAHLDSERVMNIPNYSIAERAVAFYHRYVLENENAGNNLDGLVASAERMEKSFKQERENAEKVFAGDGLRAS